MIARNARLLAAGLLALGLAGCAAMGPPPPPPPYTGADNVGAVQKSMIVGNWRGRILNPREGTPSTPYDVTYAQDGSTVYKINDSRSGMNLQMQMLGTWQVEGDLVRVTLESIKETSGNALGGMMATFMSGMKDRMTGTANVYEASANRVVLVGTDGQAVELTRQ